MILTCPACATRYQTDATKFPAQGRNVRCAKCGHVWMQAPPAPEMEEGVVAADVAPQPAASGHDRQDTPQPEYRPDPTRPTSGQRRISRVWRRGLPAVLALVAGWLIFIAIIIAIGWTGMTFRQQIASTWPQAASLYSMIGMPVNTRGIEFQKVTL